MARVSIAQWAKQTGTTLDQAARGITISLFNGVIRDTRVDTGRLRGNWQTSTGRAISSTTERMDKNGTAAEAEVSGTVESGAINYITNNLPYAPVWNERDAIIDRNMARIQTIVRQETQKARR